MPIAVATVIFAALSIWMALASPGFLEADACTHYQYARFALGEPHYLVNVWGRPFVTGLYAIPATLTGRIGVRMTSLVCALLIASVTYRIAKTQHYRWPALAFVFVLAQPLVFLHSFSELTELPFALLLALAFWAYQRRQWFVMALLTAMLPTARPEGFGFICMAAAALVLHRRWWWLVVLPLPLLIWTYAGWTVFGGPHYADGISQHLPHGLHWLMWLRHEWPYAAKSVYDAGSVLQFIALLPAVTGPLVFPFVLIGIVRSWSLRDLFRDHVARCQTLIVVIPLLILIVHSLLYALGRMASSGELRYMLIVCPFWALLIARGWEWLFERLHWRHPFVVAGVFALLPTLVNLRRQALPLRLTADGLCARAVAEWYRDTRISLAYPRIVASNPEVIYYLDVSYTDGGRVREWRKDVIAKAPPGTLLVWDSTYALKNSDQARVITAEEIEAAGWVYRPDVSDAINAGAYGNEWRVYVSPMSIYGGYPSR